MTVYLWLYYLAGALAALDCLVTRWSPLRDLARESFLAPFYAERFLQ